MVNATAPLAVLVDTVGSDAFTARPAIPAEVRASLDGPPLFTPGSRVVVGPILEVGPPGGRAKVQVQNLSSTATAFVQVTLNDAWGGPVAPPTSASICAGGVGSFELSLANGAGWAGSVRVESLPGPGSEGTVDVPNIGAQVQLESADGRIDATASAAAYPLLAETQSFRWPDGQGRCGTESGATLLAVPDVRAEDTSIVLTNVVPAPGVTQAAVLLYDQNGFVGARCQRLAAQQTVVLDVSHLWPLAPTFRGSAFISATWWNHAVIVQGRVRNVVGLTALGVRRAGPQLGAPSRGDPVGGDPLTVSVALPLRPRPRPARRPPQPARSGHLRLRGDAAAAGPEHRVWAAGGPAGVVAGGARGAVRPSPRCAQHPHPVARSKVIF